MPSGSLSIPGGIRQRYEAGEDVRSLQHLSRHSNIATTDIYIRGIMGTADPGASLLEERFAHLSEGSSKIEVIREDQTQQRM